MDSFKVNNFSNAREVRVTRNARNVRLGQRVDMRAAFTCRR